MAQGNQATGAVTYTNKQKTRETPRFKIGLLSIKQYTQYTVY